MSTSMYAVIGVATDPSSSEKVATNPSSFEKVATDPSSSEGVATDPTPPDNVVYVRYETHPDVIETWNVPPHELPTKNPSDPPTPPQSCSVM